MPENIICKQCGKIYPSRRKRGGRLEKFCCPECHRIWHNAYRKSEYRKTHPKIDRLNHVFKWGAWRKIINLKCQSCNKFFAHTDRTRVVCDDCKSIANKKIKIIPPIGFKYCSKCRELKELKEFRSNKKIRDGHGTACKKCTLSSINLVLRRKREKEMFLRDPKKRIDRSMKSFIYIALKNNKNGNHWESFVNFSISDLINYLEKHFKPNMTWGNYGKGKGRWSIDHVIPRSVFNYKYFNDLDFQRCWSLKNLHPLWNEENSRKSNRIDHPFQPSLQLRNYARPTL